MASVWRAIHLPTGTSAAVKVIEDDRARSDDYRRAFRREVQAMARLEHPAIVRVYDYGLAHSDHSEAPTPYLAMELAPGGTLRDRLATLDNWEALRSMLLRILDALAFAHARDLIHRDLKPENILVGKSIDDLRLADFGIAFPLDPVRERRDADSERLVSAGTPTYIAPEQATGDWRSFGPWTDLYALGCMSFELLTGQPPFEDDNLVRLISQHVSAPIPAFEPRMACPEDIEVWLHGLLGKRPGDRFRSAPQAARSLLELGASRPVQSDRGEPPSALANTEVISETLPMLGTALRTTDIEAATRTQLLEAGREASERTPEAGNSQTETGREVALPDDWRRADLRTAHDAFVSGLGLFGLREVPYTGREDARDALWRLLRDVIAYRTPHAALITGPAGIGKSRLSEWLIRRARELDVAEVLRVHHDPDDSPGAGMARLFTRHFRIWGLDDDAASRRIREQLQSVAPHVEPDLLDHDTQRLLQMARPTIDLARHSDRRDLLASLKRWFAWTAARQPMVIWFDDVQWATESLELTLAVLGANQNHRVLAVVTARDEELGGPRAELFGRLEQSEKTTTLALDALDAHERRQLTRAVLPLEDRLIDRVATRTSGHPLFTVHLVSAWVEERALSATQAGYTLANPDTSIPDDATQICRRRLDNLLEAGPPETRPAHRRALELAATLGAEPRRQDWERTVEAANLEVDLDALAARLTESGIARPSEQDWRFAHDAFRSAALSMARDEGRTKRNHRACARAIQSVVDSDDVAHRLARHLMGAEQYEAALEPMLEAFGTARYGGHWDQARELLEMHRAAAEALGYADDHPVVLRNVVEEALTAVDQGQLIEGKRILLEAWDAIHASAPPELLSDYLAALGSVHLFDGRPSEALAHYDRAQEMLVDNDVEVARVLNLKSECLRILGRLEDALDLALRAADMLDPTEHANAVIGALANAGYLANQLGRHDEAEAYVDRALDYCDRDDPKAGFDLGELWNVLGEVARMRGAYEEALAHYERGRLLFGRSSALLQVLVMDINIGIALVELERWEEAVETLLDAAEELEAKGDLASSTMARIVAGVGVAAMGDWSRWDSSVEPGLKWLLEHEIVERENAEYAELAAKTARQAGRQARARLADEVARTQRQRLNKMREEGNPSQ
jgi:serine/threonine protein kinase/tetratricopeptide (TPR) repeat protein